MGGLVATLAVLDAGISPDALILVAPLVDVDMSAAMKAQAVVGGLLARAVPNARITPGVEPRRLSKDADAVREYVEDPRVFVGNLRVGLGYELLKGFVRMRRRWSEVCRRCSCCTARTTRRRTRARPAGSSTRRRARIRSSSPSKARAT